MGLGVRTHGQMRHMLEVENVCATGLGSAGSLWKGLGGSRGQAPGRRSIRVAAPSPLPCPSPQSPICTPQAAAHRSSALPIHAIGFPFTAPSPPRDEAVPDVVKGWRVTYIPLERQVRHMDRTAQVDLFAAIDKFLSLKRSDLAF